MTAWRSIHPVELWARRHLILMLSVREIKVRYKQSMLGWLWAVIRPLVLILVFTYLFGQVAGLQTGGVPYPLYVFAALLAWDIFANIVQGCASSVTANRALVERAYCPRLVFPLSIVLVALFDCLVAGGLFALLALWYGFVPSGNIIFLPLLAAAAVITGLSVGLWLAAMAVWLRDVKFIVTYLIQLLLLLTPVGYGAENVPEHLSWIVTFNPMAALVEGFRWCILGLPGPQADMAAVAAAMVALMLAGGLWFFNALERSFADVI